MDRGFSMPELLVGISVLGVLAGMAFHNGGEALARQRLEAATRRLGQGLERARSEAQRQGSPCGLSLSAAGWTAPNGGELPPCERTLEGLQELVGGGDVAVAHNLPPVLRFSSNGLVLDGGTVLIAAEGVALRRCLVLSLPLGVVRLGRYVGSAEGTPSSSACIADEAL
jgi:prepilin-type N-terminal cleavage/methylation domain-containing protein